MYRKSDKDCILDYWIKGHRLLTVGEWYDAYSEGMTSKTLYCFNWAFFHKVHQGLVCCFLCHFRYHDKKVKRNGKGPILYLVCCSVAKVCLKK